MLTRIDMTLENILLDLNGNCKISNLFYFGGTKFNEFVRYDLPKLGYLMYQMLWACYLICQIPLKTVYKRL